MEGNIIGLVLALLFYALFAGGVVAFVSVDRLRFDVERKSGLVLDIISYFLRNPGDFISAMLVGKNVALVAYVIGMTGMIKENWSLDGGVLLLVEVLLSVIVVLLLGEYLSRILFKLNPDLALRVLAVPSLCFMRCCARFQNCFRGCLPCCCGCSGLSF